MPRYIFSIVPFLFSLTACGLEYREAVDVYGASPKTTAPSRATRTPDEGAPLPATLTCVTGASHRPGEPAPGVWRLQIHHDGERASVSRTRGPKFHSRASGWPEDGAQPETHDLVVRPGGVGFAPESGGLGLHVELERDGAVLRGTLVDDACYQMAIEPLTCWNDAELFGSPWAGEPGAFAARYDWATGSCVDADGGPARNAVPIEVVRETRHGECADLSGVALNGEDYGYPELSWWYLPGADLRGATLFFAKLDGAVLYGADLSEIEYGYAKIEATIDGHTILPEQGRCDVEENPWGGSQLSCAR